MIATKLKRALAPILFLLAFIPWGQAHATTVQHVRVVWQENPANEAWVAWTTKGIMPKKNNIVYYDTVPRKDPSEYRYKTKASVNGLYFLGTSHVHGSKLLDLMPSTRYYFVVRSSNTYSKEYNFITAPIGEDSQFKLLFGGDSRSDKEMRRSINKKLRAMLEEDPSILALVHGGDYAEIGFLWGQWKDWLEDHELTYTKDGRVLPIVATRGNHETSNRLFDNVFMFPGGSKSNYYVSRVGPLSLIILDSQKSVAGDQKTWLESTLAKESKTARWISPGYHTPAFPGVKAPGEALQHWVPLFEKYQVDVVFESDGHVLKRTAPIYGGKVDHEKGITYVGEGGLGVKIREPEKANAWYFQAPGYAVSEYHVFVMEVTPEAMHLNVQLMDGRIFDRMTFYPKQR